MNIHAKNMKQVSTDMTQWVRSNLSQYGIYECNYTQFNVVQQTLTAIPSACRWHYHFMEQNLDLYAAKRLTVGAQHWQKDQLLFKQYQKFTDQSFFTKIDFVQKTHSGFHLMSFSCMKELTLKDYAILNHYFHHLDYHVGKLIKQKPNLSTELRDYHNIKQKFDGHD